MDKRLPLLLFLSFLIFFAWSQLFPPPPKPKPSVPPPSADAPAAGELPQDAALSPAATPALAASEESELSLDVGGAGKVGAPGRRGAYRARFSNRGARLVSLSLADYVRVVDLDEAQRLDPENWLVLLTPVETSEGRTGSLLWDTRQSSAALAPQGLSQVLWQVEELAAPEVGVRFRYSPPGGAVVFEKVIVFEPETWHLRVTLALENVSAGPGKGLGFAFVPAGCVPPELGDRFYAEPSAVAIKATTDGGFQHDHMAAPRKEEAGTFDVQQPVTVFGVHDKYFACMMREAGSLGTIGSVGHAPVHENAPLPRALILAETTLSLTLPPEGERRAFEYIVYAGPKDREQFVADFAAHEVVIDEDLGWTDSIAKGLLYVLGLFQRLVGNWGIAIILLTLCVRLVLFPLNRRAQTAMARYQKKMKRVQPRLEDAKKRFEGDPQKLREAQARIMQEEGAFPPLGGCLPIFLQMPIFFGLFSALRTSFDLRQAPFFGWVRDLSRPDQLMHVGLKLPVLPDIEYLNLFPILMVVLWVLQQMGMPKPTDEQQARMHRMMLFMPVLFGVMLYNYAAGLSLYMMTTSTLSIVEQKVIKKLWPIDDTEVLKAKKGCGPFSGVMQHLAEKQREQAQRMQGMQNEQRRCDGRKGNGRKGK